MRYTCNECGTVFHENYLVTNRISGESFCPICSEPIDIYENGETENYKKFKNILAYNTSVTELINFDEFNENTFDVVVHNIAKELLTDKKCPHCEALLYCSDLPNYDYVCVECEENFYECEVK